MKKRLLAHRPSPAMLVAVVALVSSLTGGALAAALIDTSDIQNGAVTKKKLHKNSVNTKKVKNGSLLEQDFQAGELPGNGPQGPKGDPGEPGPASGPAGGDLDGNYPNPSIADGAVKASKLGNLTTRSDEVSIPDGNGDVANIECNAGELRISGGTSTVGVGTAAGWSLIRSGPTGTNGWSAAARNETGSAGTLVVQALCLEAG